MAGNQKNLVSSLGDEERVQQTRRTETAQVPSSNSVISSKPTIDQQRKFNLEDLKNMFKSAIDAEVVEMIWQDSNENSDVALMFLTEISPNSPPTATIVKMSSWSDVLGSSSSIPFTANQGVKPKSTVKEKHRMVEPIQLRINNLEKILIIMRGVPGSGKSYLAHQLKGNGVVLSADGYFINQGQYVFDRNLLGFAHEWNQKRASEELQKGTNPIIIDNTNLEAWEMQPYVIMALRHNYSVELIEPDTPWREDVRILSQKNIHRVPREKIREMLEKQRVMIDIAVVVENCRQKMSQSFQGTVTSVQTNRTIAETADMKHCNAETDQSPVLQKTPAATNYQIASSSSLVNVIKKNECDEQPIEKSASMPHIPQASGNSFLQKTVTSPLLEALMTNDTTIALKPSTTEVAIQTSLFESEPPLRELTARSRSIQSAITAPGLGKKLYSSKYSLDKGCLTDELVEELAAREALAILKSYFPTKETDDLADILKQCNGDLTWAVNVLLDSGYECGNNVSDCLELEDGIDKLEDQPNCINSAYDEAVENMLQQTTEEETNSVTSSETPQQSFSTTSATLEETESLRKHIEDCFQLTDTISEQTRRICGKEYNQFRASQLQKSRYSQNQLPEAASAPTIPTNSVPLESQTKSDACHLSLASFPTLGEQVTYTTDYQLPPCMNTENKFGMDLFQPFSVVSPPLPEEEVKVDEDPMISMTLDASFVQQLVKLFGVPDLKAKRVPSTTPSNPVNVDIPWSLAEQIYLHWCSSLISENEDKPMVTEDRKELQNIMDFELAMQLVQDERIAERKELRESLSTKLSFQMLQENYPSVDPLALDALFEANNYNYSHTVTALNASLGTKPQPPKMQIVSANSRLTREETQARTQKRESKPPHQEPRDLRTEAFLYNKLRQQYSMQAQEYHQRGMSAAAMYYSSESRRYAELYKKCNQQAALQIVEEKNAYQDERTIDLHELHVVEALTCLESFIVENAREGRNVVQVITGRGNNSQNGKPRIKPAVVTFLKQKRYGYEEVNPGMLRVFLSRSMTR
ncbi:uncharacterized protein LOC130700002 [Daphnia carinata]|uniref:uncharacterized protein LOC130700002 n=1 Tax=Daphnia carinata TaxID=120202 RepID=UPI00257C9AA5|nr:uncharacterized protein LOC130700002 [Daphnia carinata]